MKDHLGTGKYLSRVAVKKADFIKHRDLESRAKVVAAASKDKKGDQADFDSLRAKAATSDYMSGGKEGRQFQAKRLAAGRVAAVAEGDADGGAFGVVGRLSQRIGSLKDFAPEDSKFDDDEPAAK